jgi:polysaccharide pyruvyl transferase WcaK-like protein
MLILFSLVLKLISSQKLRRKLIESNPCLRELDECDVVASIAGGDSFSDIYGIGRLLYVSLPQVFVMLFGKRLVLLPQTIGPFTGRTAKAIAKYILNQAELIYSRDYQGLKDAKDLMGANSMCDKLRFCYDVGFVVDPTPPANLCLVGLPARRREGSPLVGVNISGLLSMGGFNHRDMFGLNVIYDELVYGLIDFLILRKGADVLLIPHVFGSGGECDTPVCEKIYETLRPKYGNSIGLARGPYNLGEIKYIIGLCDFFTGARMHACIAAISQNVPTVPFAYSDKFAGVMQTVGVDGNVVDLRTMGQEHIFSVVGRVFDQRVLVRQQLEQAIPQVRETVLNLFDEMDGMGPVACARLTTQRVPVGDGSASAGWPSENAGGRGKIGDADL